ncbi:MAG TPA: methylmalonyl-CoA mutase family protein, partial [Nocardioides sp.]|nr:methylmalonyl-CoA mutase family protein [Nocardioides sp.]
LRTQQVIMEETGVVNVADPLGGSWYVEALTDQIEAEANAIFDKILAMGGSDLTHADTEALATASRHHENPVTRGLLRGIEDGWFMSEIAEAAFQYQTALEKGEKKIVGVNVHTDSITSDLEILRISHEVELEQVRTLAERRTTRDEATVATALQHLVQVARTEENLIEPILEACRVEATLGEICDALRAEWGEYREPARF